MTREAVRDFYQRIIGWIDIESNGDQVGRDFYQRIVARGDACSLLISMQPPQP